MTITEIIKQDTEFKSRIETYAFNYVFLAKNVQEMEKIERDFYKDLNSLPGSFSKHQYIHMYAGVKASYLKIRDEERSKPRKHWGYD